MHFTSPLLDEIDKKGVDRVAVRLLAREALLQVRSCRSHISKLLRQTSSAASST